MWLFETRATYQKESEQRRETLRKESKEGERDGQKEKKKRAIKVLSRDLYLV